MPPVLTILAADDFSHWGPIAILLVMGLAFAAGNVVLTQVLSRVMGTRRTGPVKGTIYESGVNPVGSAQRRFNVRFYMVAMTFLVFDVEIVFLYPWATVFPSLSSDSGLGPLFLGRVLFFLLTSAIAFAYAWRKGIFRYD